MTTTDFTLPDPSGSRAVLVGPADYAYLSPLPAVPRNVARLHDLLTDPEIWGLPAEHCVALTDAAVTDEVEEALLAAARAATDTLLFYFAGHGLLDIDSGQLFLALGNAENDPIHRAVDYQRVRRAMLEARCPSKVVILDCCYSGKATMGDFADQTVVEGTYLLTACDERSLAVAPPDASLTAFTGALARLLAEGLPGGPELLRTEDLYWRLRDSLLAAGHPVPQQRVGNRGHYIVLARNRAARRSTPVESASASVESASVELPSVGSPPAGPSHAEPPPPGPRAPTSPAGPSHAEPRPPALRDAGGRPPWLAPAAVVQRLAEMRADGGDRAAAAFLDTIGAWRARQEVVGIVEALDTTGAPADADRVLAAAARRPSAEVADLIGMLAGLRRPAVLARFRRQVAGLAAASVVAVAGRLIPAERDALLDAAVDARFGRPDDLIALVATLSTEPGLDGVLETLLERTAARIPPDDAAGVGDVLREAGREEAAFLVYAAATAVLARRSPVDIASLAEAMHTAGHEEQARELVGRALSECGQPGDYAAMLLPLWATAIPYAVEDTVASAASTLTGPDLLLLAEVLWRGGYDQEAGDLVAAAAARRPVAEIIGCLRAVAEAGRPWDARRVVEAAASREAGEVAELFRHLQGTDPLALEFLIDAVVDQADPAKAGALIVLLEDADGATAFLGRLAKAHAGNVLAMTRGLDRPRQRVVARRIAAEVPGALEAVIDDLAQGTTIVLPGHKMKLYAQGPPGRETMVIDAVVSSPSAAAHVAATAENRPVIRSLLANQLIGEPPGVFLAFLTRIWAAGDTVGAEGLLERLAEHEYVPSWTARVWHVGPEPAGTGGRRPDLVDRFLSFVVEKRSPRQVAALLDRLDGSGAGPMAERIVEALRADPGRWWSRAHIAGLLGDSPHAAALLAGWSADGIAPVRAVAAAAVRQMLAPAPDPRSPFRTARGAAARHPSAAGPDSPTTIEATAFDVRGDVPFGRNDRCTVAVDANAFHCEWGRIKYAAGHSELGYLAGLTREEADQRIRHEIDFLFHPDRQRDVPPAYGVGAMADVIQPVVDAVRAARTPRLDDPLGHSPAGRAFSGEPPGPVEPHARL
ncbi:caspase, EACC1-associated type [Actinoplanes sp. CA-142083]|uniref:caspase, EACC1-associated type n=1 Tax=Actinoplanes sp. CA-142083 TaxID=3239903 RepID=UPI003D905F49